MARPRVQVNHQAVDEILTSPGVIRDLESRVRRVEAAAGDGFVGGVDRGSKRARGYVVTANQHGMHAEAKDRRLTRALEAGRG